MAYTVVLPKEGQMRFAGQASRSNRIAIFCANGYRIWVFWDLEWYVREHALRVTWLSFGILRYRRIMFTRQRE
jgi:hypothetical protein